MWKSVQVKRGTEKSACQIGLVNMQGEGLKFQVAFQVYQNTVERPEVNYTGMAVGAPLF